MEREFEPRRITFLDLGFSSAPLFQISFFCRALTGDFALCCVTETVKEKPVSALLFFKQRNTSFLTNQITLFGFIVQLHFKIFHQFRAKKKIFISDEL